MSDMDVDVQGGCAVQFFLDGDLTEKTTRFVARQATGQTLQLRQSHGWLDGTMTSAETILDARARYDPLSEDTWPIIVPQCGLFFVDRFGKPSPAPQLRVKLEDLREPCAALPELSILFVRWGGNHRLGEDWDPADEGDGGWGGFGSPPSDWYMDAIVKLGIMKHAVVGGVSRDHEVVSLFVGGNSDMTNIIVEASSLVEQMQARKKASFWMLWGADFTTDWISDWFIGYIERKVLFQSQRALEAAGVKSTFPHPADLWEYITSKEWMATLSPDSAKMRLPACTLVSRASIKSNPQAAAADALAQLRELRKKSYYASCGGPSQVNRKSLTKGVVKIGWSWEAKFVWFWKNEAELISCLTGMIKQPGCRSEQVIVQEWVDFDFELRFFFLPPRDWSAGQILEPTHFEYTSWKTHQGADAPGAFVKPKPAEVLTWWSGDQAALDSAHEAAKAASQNLITHLLSKHNEIVPMIRMDWMLKKTAPGKAQVVFGEYCEMGACCLKWEAGPPKIWGQALDYALNQ